MLKLDQSARNHILFIACCLGMNASADPALPLAPTSRDAMFAHDKPIIICNDPIKNAACAGLCTEMKISYDEMKHVNGRDIDPRRALAKPERYDNNGIKQRKLLINKTPPYEATEVPYNEPNASPDINPQVSAPDPSTQLATYEVGNADGKDCKWATIWFHGAAPKKGDLGVTDNTFGAAFNRMKHLAHHNQGLYYSPFLEDFGPEDHASMKALVKRIRAKTCPKGKIILNCGSAGTSVCWDLAADKEMAKEISGMVLIGSAGGPTEDLEKSEIVKRKVPIVFTHGEKDGPEHWRNLVLKLHKADPAYPIRFVLFQKGGHMTPLRMLDWRETMNCMLTQAPEAARAAPALKKDPASAESTK